MKRPSGGRYHGGFVVGSTRVKHKKSGEVGLTIGIKGGLGGGPEMVQVRWDSGLTQWLKRRELKC
jgi:hypothetical protein